MVDEYLGTNAYMEIGALRRVLGEGDTLSGAYLGVDRAVERELFRRLEETPRVAGVALQRATIESFQATLGENVGMVRTINMAFAAIIAIGVVFNSARISLSERSRELAKV